MPSRGPVNGRPITRWLVCRRLGSTLACVAPEVSRSQVRPCGRMAAVLQVDDVIQGRTERMVASKPEHDDPARHLAHRHLAHRTGWAQLLHQPAPVAVAAPGTAWVPLVECHLVAPLHDEAPTVGRGSLGIGGPLRSWYPPQAMNDKHVITHGVAPGRRAHVGLRRRPRRGPTNPPSNDPDAGTAQGPGLDAQPMCGS